MTCMLKCLMLSYCSAASAWCRVGVTSEPECTVKELTPVDKFMILASDGVWEFIESQDAVDIVGNCETVEEGCRQVCHLIASLRWSVVSLHANL